MRQHSTGSTMLEEQIILYLDRNLITFVCVSPQMERKADQVYPKWYDPQVLARWIVTVARSPLGVGHLLSLGWILDVCGSAVFFWALVASGGQDVELQILEAITIFKSISLKPAPLVEISEAHVLGLDISRLFSDVVRGKLLHQLREP
ncbi:hypothetical protein DY000_02007992 [Brassica cretica]|uniref:Uncharacterized protein n=1 Tax=Brassica cretica TaxID=69181 RepID=A0ABQ7C5S7_BRACR|nr:hypothetical protein DY000_02007992 [Brassica cretica]